MLPASGAPIIGVIPARLASTRLPRKMLRTLAGKPLLAWVRNAAAAANTFDRVIVAVDSEEIADLCQREQWEFQMTSPELPSGTDRVHAVAQQLAGELGATAAAAIFVNIQGDEPLLQREHFHALLQPFTRPEVQVATLKTRCPGHDIANPNAVKVVTAHDGRALYFSRATIPFDRDGSGGVHYWKHLGLYAYRKPVLDRFPTLPPSQLEQSERLEQLRLLDNGIDIHVAPVEFDSIGVDTEADLQAVEAVLTQRFRRP